jgi:thioredoxin
VKELLSGEGGDVVESDADEQVLVQIGLQTEAKISAIQIRSVPGREEEAPGVVKLYVNLTSVDFSDIEAAKAAQTFELSAADYTDGVATLELFAVKFVKTTSLTVFIERALDESSDVTAFASLDVMAPGSDAPVLDVPFVATEADFDKVLRDAGSTPVIVDFTASWCGPCKRIKPLFTALANTYKDTVRAVKVDVDVNKPVTRRYGVSSYPTFLVFRGGEQVDKVGGADPEKVTALFAQYGGGQR